MRVCQLPADLSSVYPLEKPFLLQHAPMPWFALCEGLLGRAREHRMWGRYAFDKRSGFLELSALKGSHRIDYVRSPEYEYLDGRLIRTGVGGLSAKGAIAVRRRTFPHRCMQQPGGLARAEG